MILLSLLNTDHPKHLVLKSNFHHWGLNRNSLIAAGPLDVKSFFGHAVYLPNIKDDLCIWSSSSARPLTASHHWTSGYIRQIYLQLVSAGVCLYILQFKGIYYWSQCQRQSLKGPGHPTHSLIIYWSVMHSLNTQVQDKYGPKVHALLRGLQLFFRDSDVTERPIQRLFYSVSCSFVVPPSIAQVKGLKLISITLLWTFSSGECFPRKTFSRERKNVPGRKYIPDAKPFFKPQQQFYSKSRAVLQQSRKR